MKKIMRLNGKNSDGNTNHTPRGEALHKSQCILCKAEIAAPGLEAEIKALYMRFTSAEEISEIMGEYPVVTKVTETIGKGKNKTTRVVDHTEMQRNLPEKTIRRHAIFFGWDVERSSNLNHVLDTIIDVGLNTITGKLKVDERTLIHAIDMKNKMEGRYFKPGKNPRDLRQQMRATVEQIYQRHLSSGQTDVSYEDIIENLSHRPGFTHIKTILKDERFGE